MQKTTTQIVRMVELALLIALVVVLQLVGTFIKIGPLPMSLVLVPIVIGGFLRGPKAGAVLGLAFGIVTAIMGITGADAFSALLWGNNPIAFVIICLLKATAAGLGAALIYKGLLALTKGKYATAMTVVASACAPIINTGIFVLGMFVCYFDTMNSLPSMFPDAFGGFSGAIQVVLLGLAGVNFLGELAVNLILSPAIVRIVSVIGKRL